MHYAWTLGPNAGALAARLRNLSFTWWTQDPPFSQRATINIEYSNKHFAHSMSFSDYINPMEYALLCPFYRYGN